ncbi:endonuclease domain-containing protein [Oryzibacter oryziterrae]|uniref:endonuclease domain-containing protein n=1 Tax=Oryzibacter oryziterrae TaxID=2766474 RepID=UPI001F37078A|nr:endonuclease domain-containing protein [Oryzibacter oryziterrae]
MPHRITAPRTRAQARRLRRDQTSAEDRLWEELRAKRFFEYRFRRQVPVDGYIADFVCFDERLIIEVDGPSHQYPTNTLRDLTRSTYLEGEGFRILRISNEDIFEAMEGVLHAIGQYLPRYVSDLAPLETPLPVPPPQGGRERK